MRKGPREANAFAQALGFTPRSDSDQQQLIDLAVFTKSRPLIIAGNGLSVFVEVKR